MSARSASIFRLIGSKPRAHNQTMAGTGAIHADRDAAVRIADSGGRSRSFRNGFEPFGTEPP